MTSNAPHRVIIAGGGLAGLSCAKRLVDRGHQVSIFEGMPFLGGRASTFRDEDGEWIEQGLHIFLGAYSELQALLRELGQPPNQVLHWMNHLRLADPEGARGPVEAVFGIDPLRAPGQTLKTLLGHNDYLGPLDKLSLLPLGAPALGRLETLRKKHDQETVAEWWSRVSGNTTVLERFIRPFCRAVQFTEPELLSAFNFLGLLHQVAFAPGQLHIAGYRGARDETFFAPLGRYLTDRGATIEMNTRLEELVWREGHLAGFRFSGVGEVRGDAHVAALPVWALLPLIPEALRALPFFAQLEKLPVAPAISVQLWFDRPVVGNPLYTLVANTRAAVYAEQSQNAYPTRDGGGRISVIVSPADELLDSSNEALIDLVLRTLTPIQPDLGVARVTKTKVLKHRQHLVRPTPGTMSLRPSQTTPVDGLFFAGDWTQQDFFGSQEGAVRGGNLCARAILDSFAGRARRAG